MSAQSVVDVTPGGAEAPTVTPTLLDAVRDLRRDVQRTRFPLEVPGAAEARRARAQLLEQLDGHLLPRLERLSTPAVVVAAGSTGAGKSTLVNSVLGTEVSRAGVLRPTTRRPVLAHHPADADLLGDHPLLGVVDVVAHARVPRGIVLVDAPDLDSVVAANRQTAHRLLEAADLWLFVTTAARYGDALPWGVLRAAVERRAAVAMVLNRVPAGALSTVRGDLLDLLRGRGMDGVPLFVVPDAGPHQGLLPDDAVAPVRRWLTTLAGADHARAVIARTLGGSLASLSARVGEQADAVAAQAAAAADLRVEVAAALARPLAHAPAAVVDGAVADVAVRDRWSELARGPLARVVGRSGRLRGTRRAGRRREAALLDLTEHLRVAATAHLQVAGRDAAAAVAERLRAPGAPAGAAALVAGWPSPGHVEARGREAARAAAGWVTSAGTAVRALTAQGGPDGARRATAAVAALGEGGLAAVALAGAAGVEPAAQLVDVALGDAAPDLVETLRDGLVACVREAVAREGESLDELLTVPDLAEDAPQRLHRRLVVLEGLT